MTNEPQRRTQEQERQHLAAQRLRFRMRIESVGEIEQGAYLFVAEVGQVVEVFHAVSQLLSVAGASASSAWAR